LDGVVILWHATRRRGDSRSHGKPGRLSCVHVLRSRQAHGGARRVQHDGWSEHAGSEGGTEGDDGGGVGTASIGDGGRATGDGRNGVYRAVRNSPPPAARRPSPPLRT